MMAMDYLEAGSSELGCGKAETGELGVGGSGILADLGDTECPRLLKKAEAESRVEGRELLGTKELGDRSWEPGRPLSRDTRLTGATWRGTGSP